MLYPPQYYSKLILRKLKKKLDLPDNTGMKLKRPPLTTLTVVALSTALMLTACSTDSSPENNPPATGSSSTGPVQIDGYDTLPEEMNERYTNFFYNSDSVGLEFYESAGATTYAEDSATRQITEDEWGSLLEKDPNAFNRAYGEILYDISDTAKQATEFLAANPDATAEELNQRDGLIINRYSTLGSTKIEQDPATGFFFVVFTMDKGYQKGHEEGVLVYQEGITPRIGIQDEAFVESLEENGIQTEGMENTEG